MTTGYISQFLGTAKVGDVCMSPVNFNDPNWMRMDGSILVRANYPVYSGMCGNVGTFTPTIRVTPGVIGNMGIATNGTTIIACQGATAGGNNLMYSTNGGVTWTTLPASGTGVNSAPAVIQWNGWCYSAFTSGASTGYYSSTSAGTGGWVAITGSPYIQTVAANLTNGTMVAVLASPGGGSVFVSTNAAVPNFSIATTPSLANLAGSQVVCAGTQFIIFGYSFANVGYMYSATGASGTWTGVANPPWGTQPVTGAASDGAGNVLVTFPGSSIAYASSNGGATWRQVLLPANTTTSGYNGTSYANGKWFVSMVSANSSSLYTYGDMAVSSDLLTWTLVPGISYPSANVNSSYATQVVCQGGNYILSSQGVSANSLSITYTATEDTTKMYLPTSKRQTMSSAVNFGNGAANYQEWIKVQ
jgi:hypothetical protein